MSAPDSPEAAFLAAVIERLQADEAVRALCGKKIYDEPPADRDGPQPPYIHGGPIHFERIELGCGQAWRARLRLFCVSSAFGRKEAWGLAHAAATALDGALLTLAEPWRVQDMVRVVQRGDVIEPQNPKSTFIDLATDISAAG